MPRADPPKFKFLKREEGNSRYSKGGLAALRERANSLRAQKPQRDTPSPASDDGGLGEWLAAKPAARTRGSAPTAAAHAADSQPVGGAAWAVADGRRTPATRAASPSSRSSSGRWRR